MQNRGQFFCKISSDRTTDERLGGGQQGAIAGEPGRRAGPKTICPETGDLAKGVEAAAMRIAGQVAEFSELSENGEVDVCAEGAFQIRKRCDFVVEQQLS